MSRGNKKNKERIILRYRWFFTLTILVLIGVVCRVIYLQTWESEALQRIARQITENTQEVDATRGSVLATDGEVLVHSVPYYIAYMDTWTGSIKKNPSLFLDNVDTLSICLSELYKDKSAKEYRQTLTTAHAQKRRYLKLSNQLLDYTQKQKIESFPLFRKGQNTGGLILRKKSQRIMPFNDLAKRTIGYKGENDYGKTIAKVGLEKGFDVILKGQDGLSISQRIGKQWVPLRELEPSVNGKDIQTTIDVHIQEFAQRSLAKRMLETKAESGSIIVMNVKTSEVLAISNYHRQQDSLLEEVYNSAVATVEEPGSTIKPIWLAVLIDGGFISPLDKVSVADGKWVYKGHIIRDSYEKNYDSLSIEQVLALSSNIGMARLITNLFKSDEKEFVNRLYNIHMNEALGIPIPGEGEPVLKYPTENQWSGISLAQMSYGYELEMTPLNILSYYNALANGGYYVTPRFAKHIVEKGKIVRTFNDPKPKQIFSKNTCRQVTAMLEKVVTEGTAMNIATSRYRIAGKTGTAQIAEGNRGYQGRYRSSFAGYFPAEKPKYSCIVVISDPQTEYYGNTVAAPVFKEMTDFLYAYDTSFSQPLLASSKEKTYSASVIQGKVLQSLLEQLNKNVPDLEPESWVMTVNKGDENIHLTSRVDYANRVPDVVGMSLSDAVLSIEQRGYHTKSIGLGKVVSQTPPEGSTIEKGKTIYLQLQ